MDSLDKQILQIQKALEDRVFDEGDSEIYVRSYQKRKDDGRYDKYEEWSKEWREGIIEFQRDLDRGIRKNEREADKLLDYMMSLLHGDTPERRSRASSVDDLIERSFSNLLRDYTSREPWDRRTEGRDQQYSQKTFYNFVDRDLSLEELKERNDFYNFVDEDIEMSRFKDMLEDE